MGRLALDEREAPAPASEAYDDDLYSWALKQARLLRNGRPGEVDRVNVAEELESLARREASKLESALAVLLLHMLKWDHQPDRISRSWANSIAAQRERYHHVLADNPGLKSKRGAILGRAYRYAARWASSEMDIPRDELPEGCPYTLDDIIGRAFEYEPLIRRD